MVTALIFREITSFKLEKRKEFHFNRVFSEFFFAKSCSGIGLPVKIKTFMGVIYLIATPAF